MFSITKASCKLFGKLRKIKHLYTVQQAIATKCSFTLYVCHHHNKTVLQTRPKKIHIVDWCYEKTAMINNSSLRQSWLQIQTQLMVL